MKYSTKRLFVFKAVKLKLSYVKEIILEFLLAGLANELKPAAVFKLSVSLDPTRSFIFGLFYSP